jgi:hypothetical protein
MIAKPPNRRDLQRFPDFLGIGAQKAGTTWLHHNLRSHPDIWPPPVAAAGQGAALLQRVVHSKP